MEEVLLAGSESFSDLATHRAAFPSIDPFTLSSNRSLLNAKEPDLTIDREAGVDSEWRSLAKKGDKIIVTGKNKKIDGTPKNDTIDASKGKGKNSLFGGKGNDKLIAGESDRLFGEEGNDLLDARKGKGKNSLDGGKGNDTLHASKKDKLKGGKGNDVLWAGEGSNELSGEQGDDEFRLANKKLPGKGNKILDFEDGSDLLSIQNVAGVNRFSDLTIAQSKSNTSIQVKSKTIATLIGVNAGQISSDDFAIEAKSAFFAGGLQISQSGLLAGRDNSVIFNVQVAKPSQVGDVQLFEKSADGSVKKLGTLVDDGDVLKGDDIQGDGVFSNTFVINPTEPGNTSYYAQLSKGKAKSDVLDVEIVTPIDTAEFQEILNFNANLDFQFETALSGGQSVEEALTGIETVLQSSSDSVKADSIVTTEGAIAWETVEGISVVLDSDEYIDLQRGGSTQSSTTAKSKSQSVKAAADDDDAVGCNNALVLAPYAWQFEPFDESNEITEALSEAGFNVTEKRNETEFESNITVDDFKNLEEYAAIVITTHGDNFDGTNFGNGSEVVFLTGQQADTFTLDDYQVDLLTGRLALTSTNEYVITTSFIDKYTDEMPDSIVYVGSCRSTFTNTLGNTFIDKGAAAFIGYSDYVGSDFANTRGQRVFDTLLAGKTTGDISGINADQETDSDPAVFELIGSSTAKLSPPQFVNGSFEDAFDCWKPGGDARVISALGPLDPLAGDFMAIISTGLGSVADSQSSISQKFVVPDDAKSLEVTYNVISEEPLEFVGSQFDDQFEILLNGKQKVFESVNTSTWVEISGISFDGGDETVYQTGFKTITIDLQKFQGEIVELEILTFDRGDSAFDTAALIDDIQLIKSKG